MKTKKSGYIIQHHNGKKAIAYHVEQPESVKGVLAHEVDDNLKPTGKRVVWQTDHVKVIGYTD